MTAAIRCEGLRKRFDDVIAVDGLDLDVREGECFGLLGPNGAGKTTTIEMLEGLTQPDGGEIRILGLDWKSNARAIRERIGVSLQETKLNEKLTVAETIALFRSFYSDGKDPDDLIESLSLNEKRDARVGKLSGGQRQRLAVAVALAGDPAILFLDEPTTGLDPQSRLQLWEQVNRFRGEGRTVLLTTHYMDEAERLCDRVAIVDHGKVIALGTPAELISSLEGSKVIEIETDPLLPDETLEAIPGVKGVVHRGDARALNSDALAETVPRVLRVVEEQGAKLVHLSTHNATLEDLFVSLTGRELREN